jgi:hypothetical protein
MDDTLPFSTPLGLRTGLPSTLRMVVSFPIVVKFSLWLTIIFVAKMKL